MKVFGIGLNKTGTRSVAAATRRLGFRTLHKGDEATSALVDRAIAEGRPMLTYVGRRFDAYFDVNAIVSGYERLDHEYPGSKFILTTRKLDDWLASRERHVMSNQERNAEGAYDGSFLVVDRRAWMAEWDAHHEAVLTYFDERSSDFLVLNVAEGQGWAQLAPFLGRPVPTSGFPHENSDGQGTYRDRRPTSLSLRATNRMRRAWRFFAR